MDFEEELELFFIRKETSENPTNEPTKNVRNYKQTNRDKNVFNYIPLMLKHIKTLNENSWKDVYGRIIGRGRDSKICFNYLLDDGTSTMEISLFRRTNDIETVWKLENELNAVKRQMLAQNKDEIVNSLRNLLTKTKQQMDPSTITMGSKVLLYARPRHFRGEIYLNVYNFIEDKQISRDIEIAFKDHLIDWYRNNNLLLTNST